MNEIIRLMPKNSCKCSLCIEIWTKVVARKEKSDASNVKSLQDR